MFYDTPDQNLTRLLNHEPWTLIMTSMFPTVLMLIAFVVLWQPAPLTLELRIFDGPTEVSNQTQVVVYRAGERTSPVARIPPREGLLELPVSPGLYDVQAIQQRDGRVVNIRWMERLVVMAYPDEHGHHLEVVNFKSSYGALQVRPQPDTVLPDVAIYAAGARDKPAAAAVGGTIYALFVVPAGRYDLQIRAQQPASWYADIDVPLDRTRLWVVPGQH